MESNKERLAAILEGMPFERKSKVSRQQKAEYAALEAGVSDAIRQLNQLHLRLWHAVSRKDYHSLSPDDIRQTLDAVRQQLSVLDQTLEKQK